MNSLSLFTFYFKLFFYGSLAIALLGVGILFSACVLDFDSAPPWRNADGVAVSGMNLNSTVRGWGGDITVTLDLISGNIMNVRINAPRETPSFTRDLIQNAPERIEIFNSFEFLEAMSGATITAMAIRAAGRAVLEGAGVELE